MGRVYNPLWPAELLRQEVSRLQGLVVLPGEYHGGAWTPDHEVFPREPSISHYVQDFHLDGPADSDIYGTVVLLRTPAGLRVAADLTLGLKMYATVRAIGEIIPTPGRPDMSKVASATIQRFDLVLRHFGPEHASAPGRPGSPEPSLAGEFRVPKTW